MTIESTVDSSQQPKRFNLQDILAAIGDGSSRGKIAEDLGSVALSNEPWFNILTQHQTMMLAANGASKASATAANWADMISNSAALQKTSSKKKKQAEPGAVKVQLRYPALERLFQIQREFEELSQRSAQMQRNFERLSKATELTESFITQEKASQLIILNQSQLAAPVNKIMNSLTEASRSIKSAADNTLIGITQTAAICEKVQANLQATTATALIGEKISQSTVAKPFGFTDAEWNRLIEVSSAPQRINTKWVIECLEGLNGILAQLKKQRADTAYRNEKLKERLARTISLEPAVEPAQETETIAPEYIATPAFIRFAGYHSIVGKNIRLLRSRARHELSQEPGAVRQRVLLFLLELLKELMLDHSDLGSSIPEIWSDSDPVVETLFGKLEALQSQLPAIDEQIQSAHLRQRFWQ